MEDIRATILTNHCRKCKDWEPYLNLNVIFKDHDKDMKGSLKFYTDLWVKVPVITDPIKWEEIRKKAKWELREDGNYHRINNCDYSEEDLRVEGYTIGEYFLEHILKFDVYRFETTVPSNSATLGLIKYLNELEQIKNLNYNQFHDFLAAISSLHEFS